MKFLSPLIFSLLLMFSSCSMHVYHHGNCGEGSSKCSKNSGSKCDGKQCPLKGKKCPHSEGKEEKSSDAAAVAAPAAEN